MYGVQGNMEVGKNSRMMMNGIAASSVRSRLSNNIRSKNEVS